MGKHRTFSEGATNVAVTVCDTFVSCTVFSMRLICIKRIRLYPNWMPRLKYGYSKGKLRLLGSRCRGVFGISNRVVSSTVSIQRHAWAPLHVRQSLLVSRLRPFLPGPSRYVTPPSLELQCIWNSIFTASIQCVYAPLLNNACLFCNIPSLFVIDWGVKPVSSLTNM